MPIYAYKCESCGHTKDVLQKMSDAPLSDCPQCGAAAFKKQVTAAGFQLKGSGWYVTDFRGGQASTPSASQSGAPSDAGAGKAADSAPAAGASGTAAATTSPAPAPAPIASTKADS